MRRVTARLSPSPRGALRALGALALALGLTACELDIDPMRTTPASQARIDAQKAGHIVGGVSVIDGDTFEIRRQRVRLWGVDALESGQRCKNQYGQQWLCGKDAAMFLSLYIGPRTVLCEPRGKSYDRIVARCTVGGEDIGAWAVRKGWALDYPRYSKGVYAGDEQKARGLGLGMHRGPHEAPWEWRKAQQQNR